MLKSKKGIVALILAVLTAVTALAVGLSGTLAAKAAVVENFDQPNAYRTLQAGQSELRANSGGRRILSSNSAIATGSIPNGGGDITVNGIAAGVMVFTVGSANGNQLPMNYQIVDVANPTGYSIANGGEMFIPPAKIGVAQASPVTAIPSNTFGEITWRSLQSGVAEVNAAGAITAKAKGSAIIIGEFADKWGVKHDLHVLVMVGISGGKLGELLEQIAKGEGILGLDPNPYAPESLADLQAAVDNGKEIAGREDPSDAQIDQTIQDIKDAINDLVLKQSDNPEGWIPKPGGGWYRPVGYPKNVYEIMDENKNPTGEFIWDDDSDGDGDPSTGGNNHPAIKGGGEITYWVEEPAGSNIWRKVKGDGALSGNNDPLGDIIWGGPDGLPSGTDNLPVKEFGGGYWVHLGQNVWQKVNPNGNNNKELGSPVGGGPDRDPATDPVTHLYKHTDGKYFAGPLGDPDYQYYYGDPVGGDTFLDSTTDSLYGDDVIWYKVNGEMTTVPPPPPGGNPVVTDEGRTLTNDQTGDGEWVEIARYGNRSLIVRKNYIKCYPDQNKTPIQDWYAPKANNNNYGDANNTVRKLTNDWFNGVTASGQILASDARLRDFTMSHDALTKRGSDCQAASMADGFSIPTTYQVGIGNDVAFALSYTEAANFCSNAHRRRDMTPNVQPSSNAAKGNYGRLSIVGSIWLRTTGDTAGTMSGIWTDGEAFQLHTTNTGDSAFIHPALWVNSDIFNPVIPSIPGLDDSKKVNDTVSIDSRQWVIARKKTMDGGKYAMLVSKTNFNFGQNFDDSSSNYEGSKLQGRMEGYYKGMTNMKKYAVIPTLGNHTSQTATSEPTGAYASKNGTTKNIFFAISYKDVENWSGAYTEVGIGSIARYWTRTAVNISNVWDAITAPASRMAAANILGNNINDVPAVWVRYA